MRTNSHLSGELLSLAREGIMPKYITEFVGTFFLTLVIGLTVLSSTPMAPLAIGATLMVMVYMGGHISGGHYNPAVTLAVWVRRKISSQDALYYMLSQTAGAISAGLITTFIMGRALEIQPSMTASPLQSLIVETLFTLALCSVVLNVATSKDHPQNSFYGLAIGFTIVIAAFAGGPISGGAFNPAVAIGHNLLAGSGNNLWLYIAGPFLGGLLGAGLFKVTNPHEFTIEDKTTSKKEMDAEAIQHYQTSKNVDPSKWEGPAPRV